MYDSHRTCAVKHFLLVLLATRAIGLKERRCSILIVQSDMMIPRIVDATWKIDFPGAEKIMLSDAILYFSTGGKTINAEKWFAKFEKLFNTKGINSENFENLRRTVANNVGLVIVLANPSGIVTHPFRWRHWNSYMIRTINCGKIGFVDCVESPDETARHKMVSVRNELDKLNGMGVNITIALTQKSSDLVIHVRSNMLTDLILESDGGIWTKYGWNRIGTSQLFGAMLLTFNKDGLIDESETNVSDSVPDPGKRKRSENGTEALSPDKNGTSYSGRSRDLEIFVASDVIASQCARQNDCAFGNLIADAIAYYGRWRLSSPSRSWSKYPIAFFHADNARVELPRGYMSLSSFVAAFRPVEERLCVFRRRGRKIKRILGKFRGSHRMPNMQISGMYVWTDGFHPRLITARCSAGCRDYILSRMNDRNDYCIIGPRSTLTKVAKIRFLFWKKCRVLNSGVQDALRVYATDKRDIFPQAENRYWATSEKMLKTMRTGFKTEDLRSFGWCTNFSAALLFFILDILFFVGH